MATTSNHLIVWEKCQDPFLPDNFIGEPDSAYEEDREEYEEQDPEAHSGTFKTTMILTPMGMLPYTEKTACSAIFKFWVGHTNFSITNSIETIINTAKGVETLDIFTRYRFRIAVGKAFKDSDIMNYINNKTYEHLLNEQKDI